MGTQTYGLNAGRVNVLKGEILAHAVPVEVLGITGMQKMMPKNVGATVKFRRWLPFGGASTAITANVGVDAQDRFFASSDTGTDRAAAYATAQLTTEGVTPSADSLTPVDVTVALNQYSVLYAVTDVATDLYEDDIPAEMKKQTGERVGLIREMVRFNTIKAGTMKFYGGTGTTRATVNGKLTLTLLRKVSRALQGNHAKRITSVLAPSPNYATAPVEASYLVFCHSDLESDIRDIAGFKHVSEYGQRKPINENEIGSIENFRFITSPELVSIQDAASSVTASTYGLFSTAGTNPDVYHVIVAAEDGWGQVMLRGADSIDPTYLPAGTKDKNDPLGQRGYIGAKFYFNCTLLNNGWCANLEVAAGSL